MVEIPKTLIITFVWISAGLCAFNFIFSAIGIFVYIYHYAEILTIFTGINLCSILVTGILVTIDQLDKV